jgi:hypothetical protein
MTSAAEVQPLNISYWPDLTWKVVTYAKHVLAIPADGQHISKLLLTYD